MYVCVFVCVYVCVCVCVCVRVCVCVYVCVPLHRGGPVLPSLVLEPIGRVAHQSSPIHRDERGGLLGQ